MGNVIELVLTKNVNEIEAIVETMKYSKILKSTEQFNNFLRLKMLQT